MRPGRHNSGNSEKEDDRQGDKLIEPLVRVFFLKGFDYLRDKDSIENTSRKDSEQYLRDHRARLVCIGCNACCPNGCGQQNSA